MVLPRVAGAVLQTPLLLMVGLKIKVYKKTPVVHFTNPPPLPLDNYFDFFTFFFPEVFFTECLP